MDREVLGVKVQSIGSSDSNVPEQVNWTTEIMNKRLGVSGGKEQIKKKRRRIKMDKFLLNF